MKKDKFDRLFDTYVILMLLFAGMLHAEIIIVLNIINLLIYGFFKYRNMKFHSQDTQG